MPQALLSNKTLIFQLLPVVNLSKKVVAVATVPAPFYKGNDPTLDLPPAFMRVLYSSAYERKHVVAPLLDPPNMISGVAASGRLLFTYVLLYEKTNKKHLDNFN